MPKFLLTLFFLAEFVLFAFLSNSFLSTKRSANGVYNNLNAKSLTPALEPLITPIVKNSQYNFLLIGYGGEGHDGGNLSDVIMVANLNPIRKQLTFISIPRDTWVSIPVRSDKKENHKINAAYAIGLDDKNYGLKEPQYRGELGGANMAKKVVSEVTGLTITNYAAINFDSFKKIINALGGVKLNVPNTFNDHFYPVKGLENETCGFTPAKIQELHLMYSGFDLEKQFACRFEHLHFDKGETVMDGETALKFVRSRHSAEDGGDFARSRRQQSLLIGIKEKMLSRVLVKNADEIYGEFRNLLKTDLDISNFKNFFSIVNPPAEYKVKFVNLTTENVLISTKSLNGQYILISKRGENVWNEVHSFLNNEVNTD